jgi:hypothetical protein
VRVAILFPGNLEARQNATPENNRFADLFRAFAASGVNAEPAVYADDLCDEVRRQLLALDAVLVWVNPIEAGRDRSVLDSMLREVANAGVFVSTHPDMIQQLGTKEVLYRTREIGWGSDTHLYLNLDQMRRELPFRLAQGKARVLKQNRGQSGHGVWRVQLGAVSPKATIPGLDAMVNVRHAARGAVELKMTLGEFCERCGEYYQAVDGRMIDQAYQVRLTEGMIRCYVVKGQVAGFGHQAVNALFPAPAGVAPEDAPQPGPRYYHPPSKPEFQALKRKLEKEWIPAVRDLLSIEADSLPVLWDCDFLLGPKDANGEDTWVLCEINVSSVAPYPESVVPFVVEATMAQVKESRAVYKA